MLRLGTFLCNPRQVSMLELRTSGTGQAEVRAHVSNYALVRRFDTRQEAETFLTKFQEDFAKLSRPV